MAPLLRFIILGAMDFGEKCISGQCKLNYYFEGIPLNRAYAIKVVLKGVMIGEYAAALFIDDKVITALKFGKKYDSQAEPHLLNES